MNKHIKNALRLTWGEVSYYISGYVSRYLGRNIVCKATVEDGNYWDTSAVNTEFTKSEFRTLLSLVFADDFMYHESLPKDSDTSRSLGMELSEALLKMVISSAWHCCSIHEDGLWLIGIDEKCITLPEINPNILLIDNCVVDTSMLMSKDILMQKLENSGGMCSDLSALCKENVIRFGNELYWHCPLPDSEHSGYYFVLVKEGVLSIPYNYISDLDEEFALGDAYMCGWKDMINFQNSWHEYAKHTEKTLEILGDYLGERGDDNVKA